MTRFRHDLILRMIKAVRCCACDDTICNVLVSILC